MQKLLLLITSLFAAGCCPSLNDVVEMRRGLAEQEFLLSQMEPAKAGKQREKYRRNTQRDLHDLMMYFSETQSNAYWRAETMTTMVSMSRHLDTVSADPAAHARLINLLKSEHRSPNLVRKKGVDTLPMRLRAWSAYMLGNFTEAELDAYFVDALAHQVGLAYPEIEVELAIMNSLSRRMASISADIPLRNRLLALLPTLTVRTRNDRSMSAADKRVFNDFIRYLEISLKTYDAVVDLLPHAADQRMPDDEVMIYLGWTYQNLATGRHLLPGSEQHFKNNVMKLLSLAWHSTPSIRTRARITLGEFAPMDLFNELHRQLSSGSAFPGEDSELLGNLLPVADSIARGDERYLKRRQEAFDEVFNALERVPLESREVLYARVLEHDHLLLYRRLVAVSNRVYAEPEQQILQHLRYLRHLRTKELNTPDEETAKVIASFARRRFLSVRQQVDRELVNSQPRILALGMLPALRAMASEEASLARFLTASYIACLKNIAAAGASMNTDESTRTAGHFYDFLSHPLDRQESDIRQAVIDFLSDREPERLVMMLCEQIHRTTRDGVAPGLTGYAMLGDTVQRLQDKLSDDTLEAARAAIAVGVRSDNEEQVLLCCRYLFELGGSVSGDDTAGLPESARIMRAMAAFNRNTATSGNTAKPEGRPGETR